MNVGNCSQRTIDNRGGGGPGRAWAGVKKHDDVRAAGRMALCATDKNMPRRTDEKLSIKRDSAPARRDFTGTPPTTDERKVTGSPKKAFERFWGAKQARKLYHKESILTYYNFNLIWWDGI